MYNKFFIAVDSGKSYTKGVLRLEDNSIKRVRFRTKVLEANGFGDDINMNTDFVYFDGKKYLVGDLISEEHVNFDLTKQTNEHLISIYLAITKLLQHSKQSIAMAKIQLAVNIPINLYKNEHLRREYEDFIKKSGQVIGIEVNGKPFSFLIENIIVLPESVGPIYYQIDDYRAKRVTVVDVGSLNVSFLEVNKLIPNYDRMAVSTLGLNIFRSSLTEQLTSHYGITFNDDDVEEILQEKRILVKGREQKDGFAIINQALKKHVNQIINYAKSRKISFASQIVFVGGGSILLMDYLKEHCKPEL